MSQQTTAIDNVLIVDEPALMQRSIPGNFANTNDGNPDLLSQRLNRNKRTLRLQELSLLNAVSDHGGWYRIGGCADT